MMSELNGISGLPKGWCFSRLEEVAEINPSLPSGDVSDDTEVSFLPMKAVEEESGRFDASITRKLGEVKKGYTPFANGDVIVAKITPCMENGKAAVVGNLMNGIGFGSTEFHVLRVEEQLFLPRYLFFYIVQESFRKEARAKMTGSAGQKRVPAAFIQNAIIPVPPLPEQQRIVTKIEELFTKLDAGVKALRTARAQLRRYRQAVLKAAVTGELTREWREAHEGEREPASELLARVKAGPKTYKQKNTRPLLSDELPRLHDIPSQWTWARIGEIAWVTKLAGFEFTKFIKYQESGPVRVVRGLNVGFGNFKAENFKFIDADTSDALPRSQLHGGELLIAYVGTLGTAAILPRDSHRYHLGPNIGKVVVDELAGDARFFLLYLSSPFGQDLITKTAKAVAQSSLSMEQIRLMPVPFPPRAEQHKIIEEVERLLSIADATEQAIEQGLRQSERLRQSILKQAFAGKLVPQDPSDEPAEALLARIREERAKRADAPPKRSKPRARRKSSGEQIELLKGAAD